LENLQGRDYWTDPDINGQIILKMILKEYTVRMTGFIWLKRGSSGRYLWPL
jgi:hypothetical protein